MPFVTEWHLPCAFLYTHRKGSPTDCPLSSSVECFRLYLYRESRRRLSTVRMAKCWHAKKKTFPVFKRITELKLDRQSRPKAITDMNFYVRQDILDQYWHYTLLLPYRMWVLPNIIIAMSIQRFWVGVKGWPRKWFSSRDANWLRKILSATFDLGGTWNLIFRSIETKCEICWELTLSLSPRATALHIVPWNHTPHKVRLRIYHLQVPFPKHEAS